MRILSIFLTLMVLIAGVSSCADPIEEEPVQYSLTVSSSGGGSVITPGEDTFAYEEGTVVDLVATADDGYYFVEWTGDVDTVAGVTAAATTITMEGDYSITANFEMIPPARYSLTVSSTTGGSVIAPGEGTFSYDAGTVVDLVTESDQGYTFLEWTGDVDFVTDVTAASTTVTMNSSYNITAGFAKGIWDWYDLDAIRHDLGAHYVLMNDLDSSTPGYLELASPTANDGRGWQPIGTTDAPFSGRFDGQKYEISRLFIDRPDGEYLGLFGVSREGFIGNVGVLEVNVSGGGWRVGSLLGLNHGGSVINAYATGYVAAPTDTGGLVGFNAGTVMNSYVRCGSVSGQRPIGGLIGANTGIVSNSYYNYDEVLVNGHNVITVGALFSQDFEEWLANDGFLNVDERLSREDGHYLIDNVSDFKQILAFGQFDSLAFRLGTDLDLRNEPDFWIPYLAGEFDGDGHKIANLTFSFDFVCQVGVFGYLAPGGKVSGVGVENVATTGYWAVGGLVGWNRGTVGNSFATGSVIGARFIGGLVGWNVGTVSNSYSGAHVPRGSWIGGLVGVNTGVVSESSSTGSLTGNDYVGGLVGENRSIVVQCYATGVVSGDDYVGGLVGLNNWGSVGKSYSAGRVTGSAYVGGLVGGQVHGSVRDSFWDVQTSEQSTSGGGTGKATAQMTNIVTFSDAGWDITAVDPGETDSAYTWNIVDGQTYPFLSWQPVS